MDEKAKPHVDSGTTEQRERVVLQVYQGPNVFQCTDLLQTEALGYWPSSRFLQALECECKHHCSRGHFMELYMFDRNSIENKLVKFLGVCLNELNCEYNPQCEKRQWSCFCSECCNEDDDMEADIALATLILSWFGQKLKQSGPYVLLKISS